MAEITVLTQDNFTDEVLRSDKTVLVEFTVEWSGLCRYMSALIEQTANEMPDVKICRADADSQKALAGYNHVSALPTFIVFENGKKVKVSTGSRTELEICNLVM